MRNEKHKVKAGPETATSYLRFRRLLFGALVHLAQQGFALSPTEGLDLIHDFFAEAWDGIVSHYDSTKGKFETYVYGAFVHFARPRIVRFHRWQSCLLDTAELARTIEEQSEAEVPVESWHDVSAVRQALSQLPSIEREILHSYLIADSPSERKIAQEFSISRYRLRETLAQALGHVAALLGERGCIPESEWKVAVALWREGRTVQEAAAYLGQTVQEIRAARARIGKLIVAGLKHSRSVSYDLQRREIMQSHVSDLLKKVMTSPKNNDLLREVRARANEILNYLDDPKSAETFEEQIRECDQEWLMEIYSALAEEEEELSPEDLAVRESLFKANREHEITIGYAFKESLMADLPLVLQDFRHWFANLPEVEKDEQRRLHNDPVVQAGLPYSEQLIPYGLTPLSIFYSTEAISMLADRLMRYEVVKSDDLVIRAVIETPHEEGFYRTVLHEVANTVECSEWVAVPLLRWLVEVAGFKPFLFNGFEAKAAGAHAVFLVRSSSVDDNLYRRWSFGSQRIHR